MHKLSLPPEIANEPDGLVDLQVNGYMGISFTSDTLTIDGIRKVTRILNDRGTVAYCPTITTTSLALYERNLPLLAEAMDDPELKGRLLGLHIEGPFISNASRGAHPSEYIIKPDIALFEHWQKLARNKIKILTLAPEIEGAIELIRHVSESGVLVSLGHHMADNLSIEKAVKAGACLCTHLGNGIPNTIQRHPNPIWTQLAEDRLTAMFITDGHHIPPEFVKVAYRAKGIDRFIVTSDSASIAGMPPGDYGDSVIEPSGRLMVKDRSCLAGSSSNQRECMSWLSSIGLLTSEELIMACRINPLKMLGYSV